MPQEELDFDSLNATLDKFHRAYTSSAYAEIDDVKQKEALTNDYFEIKELLKNFQKSAE